MMSRCSIVSSDSYYLLPLQRADLLRRCPPSAAPFSSWQRPPSGAVTTEDGYILTMQRIPEGRNGDGGTAAAGPRQPVLLQHGVLMDGTTWVLNSPEESLAYVLADAGYDVWIANARGTRWSRRHSTLDSSSPAYWRWSWDELALYELPATVGFVYQKTGKRVDYVGHSMVGTLMALASLSEGRLVDKLRSAALLSPMLAWLGISEFDPKGLPVTNFLKLLCLDPSIDCYDLMTSLTGKNCCLNESTVELFLNYEPQPTSTRNMVHFAQTYRDGVPSKFDFGGRDANLRQYGQERPPAYNMSAISSEFPIFLSYGGRDFLSDVEDVRRLLIDLRSHDADKLTVQFVPEFAHVDFIIGVSAKTVVYDQVLAFFRRLG
ncbi:unnamed protein product [Spirodela intermedia]|uniref:Lipase n=1 Tax=Spirodela intermedia TaxID=51605 RepID=A0A7I8JER8_SPIIN|nr:unnamed protein product [Spirodela intermedia]CAA6667892.1 unnamed protein product [Spirodela intermedia]